MSKKSYRELAENFTTSRSEKDYKVLYDKIKPGLENYVFNVVKDNEAKDDIVTNTLTKMWTKIDQYDPQYQITTWLYRIAYNTAIDKVRSLKNKSGKEVQIENSPVYKITSNELNQDVLDIKKHLSSLDEKYQIVLNALFFGNSM